MHQDGLEGHIAQDETGDEQAGQAEQAGQVVADPIDLSNSQIDLNSNIQPSYPETSATSFNEEEEVDFIFTGNGSGAEQEDDPATNYREMAQNLIHTVQKLRVIFNKLLDSFDCFLSLYDKHTYIKNLK